MHQFAIGHDVKTKFFPGEDPIGKMIKVGELWLTVVGVLEKDLSTEIFQVWVSEIIIWMSSYLQIHYC